MATPRKRKAASPNCQDTDTPSGVPDQFSDLTWSPALGALLADDPEPTENVDLSSLDDLALTAETLRLVMRDPKAPAAARTQAARTLAEMRQQLGRHQRDTATQGAPIRAMSRADLEAELAELRAERAALRR